MGLGLYNNSPCRYNAQNSGGIQIYTSKLGGHVYVTSYLKSNVNKQFGSTLYARFNFLENTLTGLAF